MHSAAVTAAATPGAARGAAIFLTGGRTSGPYDADEGMVGDGGLGSAMQRTPFLGVGAAGPSRTRRGAWV